MLLTPKEYQEWIQNNVKDPVLMDDKSRLHELLDVLSSDDTSIPFKDFALKGLGMMAIKYSADPIILCGAIPLIKNQLNSQNPILIAQSIRTLLFIANNGGDEEIMREKVHMIVRNIASEKNTPQHIKNMGLTLYFRILDIPLEHTF
jgi:hypothetical protein